MRIGTVRFSDKFQMEVIIPIPLEWGLCSEQGTCVSLCSHLKCNMPADDNEEITSLPSPSAFQMTT